MAAAAVVGAAVIFVGAGDDEPDRLAVFCGDASEEHAALSGGDVERAQALARLEGSAPDELAVMVADAAVPPEGSLPEDLFVVPGDAMSEVRADVAAEVWADQTARSQAWVRVEQVLVGECGLRLDGSGGEG